MALSIFLISLTGLPPTAGFIGKLYLFAALVKSEWIWLAIIGAMNSVVSLYYYVKIFRNMYLRPDERTESSALDFSFGQKLLILILLFPILLFGLYFSPLVQFAQASVHIFGTP